MKQVLFQSRAGAKVPSTVRRRPIAESRRRRLVLIGYLLAEKNEPCWTLLETE